MIPLGVLASARTAPAPGGWTPAGLPGLAAWYDADDPTTLTAPGGTVSQWRDKSGNNRHINYTDGAPNTGQSVNGRTILTFVGDVAAMPHINTSIPVTGATVTVAFVWRWNPGSERNAVFGGLLHHPGMIQSSKGSATWIIDGAGGGTVTLPPAGSPQATRITYTTPGATVHANGALAGSPTGGTGPNGTEIRAVGRAHRASILLTGAIAEMVVAAGAVPELDTYLTTKWGIT